MDEPSVSGLSVLTSEILGINLFAYCSNNPVMNIDPTGYDKFLRRYSGTRDCIKGILSLALHLFVGFTVTTTGISAIILGAGGTVARIAFGGAPWFVTVPLIIYGLAATVGGWYYTSSIFIQTVVAIYYAIRYNTFKIIKAKWWQAGPCRVIR